MLIMRDNPPFRKRNATVPHGAKQDNLLTGLSRMASWQTLVNQRISAGQGGRSDSQNGPRTPGEGETLMLTGSKRLSSSCHDPPRYSRNPRVGIRIVVPLVARLRSEREATGSERTPVPVAQSYRATLRS